jgi:prepilin peptidase CpaA
MAAFSRRQPFPFVSIVASHRFALLGRPYIEILNANALGSRENRELSMIQAAIFVIFPLCLAFAACSDFLSMTIPNRASVILLAAFPVVALLAGLGPAEIGMHVLAALVVFAVCFALFAFNIMGGGDAKLLTASAIWFGWTFSLLEFLVAVSFMGGFLVLGILFLRTQENLILAHRIPLPRQLFHGSKVPYGVAIGSGAFLAFPDSPLMQMALSHFAG